MTHTPSPAEPDNRPERDGAGVPEGIAQLLSVLHWIITYGRVFAASLHHLSAEEFHQFANRYRPSDFNEILARIKRGLMLALALEQKLRKRAGTGRDVKPVEIRWDTSRREGAGSAPKRKRVRHTNIVDMPADHLPTAEQIAAELRRRPLGAVLVDICRDLGIQPGDMSAAQWKQLHNLIIRYGGCPARVVNAEWDERLRPFLDAARRRKKPRPAPLAAAVPRDATACPTGPPPLVQAA